MKYIMRNIIIIFVSLTVIMSIILVIKNVKRQKIVPIDSMYLQNIDVQQNIFKAQVVLFDSAYTLTDYKIVKNKNTIYVTIYSSFGVSKINENFKNGYIVCDMNLSGINTITLCDKKNTKEIWNKQNGIVWNIG